MVVYAMSKKLFRGGEGRKAGERGERNLKFYFKHILNPTKHNYFSIIITTIFFHLEHE
jgi:hypothetical protein